jgi:hypothetical protein
MSADAREADVGSQSAAAIKMNFINPCSCGPCRDQRRGSFLDSKMKVSGGGGLRTHIRTRPDFFPARDPKQENDND